MERRTDSSRRWPCNAPCLAASILLLVLPVSTSQALATPAMPLGRTREPHVRVLLAAGGQLKGTLLELSPAAVTLLVNGARREYRLTDVVAIETERDSLANGAAIGAAIFGGLCLVVCGQGLDSGNSLLTVALGNAAFGALVGLAIDWGHEGRRVLYPGPDPSTGGGSRRSITFRVRF